jgi:hypothetical protein
VVLLDKTPERRKSPKLRFEIRIESNDGGAIAGLTLAGAIRCAILNTRENRYGRAFLFPLSRSRVPQRVATVQGA